MSKIEIPLAQTPQDLTPAQLASLISNKALIVKWLTGVEEYARLQLDKDPRAVPGWGFGPPRRTREWVDEATAVKAIASLGINDAYTHTIKSVAAVEKDTSVERVAALEATGDWAWKYGKPSLVRVLVPDDTGTEGW